MATDMWNLEIAFDDPNQLELLPRKSSLNSLFKEIYSEHLDKIMMYGTPMYGLIEKYSGDTEE